MRSLAQNDVITYRQLMSARETGPTSQCDSEFLCTRETDRERTTAFISSVNYDSMDSIVPIAGVSRAFVAKDHLQFGRFLHPPQGGLRLVRRTAQSQGTHWKIDDGRVLVHHSVSVSTSFHHTCGPFWDSMVLF